MTIATESVFQKNLFVGKSAVVTGGGSGICLGMATALARHGAHVTIVGRTQSKLDNAKRGIEAEVIGARILALAADVRDPSALAHVMEQANNAAGRIDFLICGAAGNFLCPAEQLSTNAFKTVIDIDLVGTFNTCKAGLEYLKKSQGSVINVTATLQYKGTPFMAHACAAKAGVDALTRVLALEWGKYGIRVNGIAPGPIDDTAGMDKLLPSGTKEFYQQTVPLKRMGRVRDIEFATLYLLSDAAQLVTGHIHVVDGGEWLAGPMNVMSGNEESIKNDMANKREKYNASKL
ncbi:hypothetical protein HK100_012157 [Physocladia obscura]|uniref:2,4-dienoyl-CoA reductase [(3E)-enoyl-CoA-producing] n=1 Tax=Physocladia obscura TaxID=109957 RepID=A0AAD5T056_9FUNG|nr:hypothetical protein HK100_012157 [Physocladia obscura]